LLLLFAYFFTGLAGWTGLTDLNVRFFSAVTLYYLPGMSRGMSLLSMSLRLAISQDVKNTNRALLAINS
jgi:hypothetical protein